MFNEGLVFFFCPKTPIVMCSIVESIVSTIVKNVILTSFELNSK